MRKAINQLIGLPATTLLQYYFGFKRRCLSKEPNHVILIACYPKSASVCLTYLITEILQLKSLKVSASGGILQDNIYLPKMIDVMLKKVVIQQHLRLTVFNRAIIERLNLRPIILVRNIFDVVVSYHDHIIRAGVGPLDPDKADLSPELCKNYFRMDVEKQIDYILDMIIPWYISFYVSWYHYTINKKDVDGYWLQ